MQAAFANRKWQLRLSRCTFAGSRDSGLSRAEIPDREKTPVGVGSPVVCRGPPSDTRSVPPVGEMLRSNEEDHIAKTPPHGSKSERTSGDAMRRPVRLAVVASFFWRDPA
jgi:hypothetical protein